MARGSTGRPDDRIYSVSGKALDDACLSVRPDRLHPRLHALVEPMTEVTLEVYEASIAGTRPHWRQAWP